MSTMLQKRTFLPGLLLTHLGHGQDSRATRRFGSTEGTRRLPIHMLTPPHWTFTQPRSSRCQCGPVDDRNLLIWVNHGSRPSGSCPILAALLIEVAAGIL